MSTRTPARNRNIKTPYFILRHTTQLVALTLSLTACGVVTDGDDNSNVTPGSGTLVEFKDQGRLCIFASDATAAPFSDGPQEFIADAPITMLVVFDGCTSSSCTTGVGTGCSIALSNDNIQVSSQASYTDTSGIQANCTADCQIISTTCSTLPLSVGSYSITHGASSLTLTIPSSTPTAPCIE